VADTFLTLFAMMRFLLACAAAVSAARLAETEGVTPVEKVVTLLEDMQQQVRDDGAAEATTYDTFACFCRTTTNAKTDSIATRTTHKNTLTADLESLTGNRDQLTADIAQLNADLDAQNAALKKATEIRDKDHADYLVSHKDISDALDGLTNALGQITDSLALDSVQTKINKGVALSDAIDLGEHSETVMALIQMNAAGDYNSHSDGILDVLDGLKAKYVEQKAAIENEETASQNAFNEAASAKRGEIQTTENTIATKTDQRATAESDMATTQADLTETTALLSDDNTYVKDLAEQCERKAREWDQRSQLRKDELVAIGQALEIISGTVATKAASSGNGGRALLQTSDKVEEQEELYHDIVFTQIRSVKASSATTMLLRQRAITMLQKEAATLKSAPLTLLTMKMAADPFAKIKGLIQKLIERLISEGTSEATQKGWCDTELRTAQTDRDFRHAETQDLMANSEVLEARKVSLEQERDELAADISALNDAHTDASNTRADVKEENKRVLSESQIGLEALSKAIGILENFYKQAAKGKTSFVQKTQAPVGEDMAAAGVSQTGAYKGSAQAGGIIGMLATIKSDFERTIKETTEAEHQSDRDYVKFDRETKASITSKTRGKMHAENDLKMTNGDLQADLEDLRQNQQLLDQSNQALTELRPACVDTTMSFEERVARREAEIAALKNAACTLDEEDGELSDCPPSLLQKSTFLQKQK